MELAMGIEMEAIVNRSQSKHSVMQTFGDAGVVGILSGAHDYTCTVVRLDPSLFSVTTPLLLK